MRSIAPKMAQASRRRVATAVVFGSLAVTAWFASIERMPGEGMGGRFSVGSLGFFIVLWVLMMGAMMFPSVWPVVAMYGFVVRRRAPAAPVLARSDALTTARGTAPWWDYLRLLR